MKKYLIKLMLCLALVVQPSISLAAAHQWTGLYPIYQVYTASSGTVYIRLNPNSAHVNPGSCISSYWLAVAVTQTNVKEIFQMALTAKAAGLKANINVAGTSCVGSYARILSMITL